MGLGRVPSEDNGSVRLAYTFDRMGNRRGKTINGIFTRGLIFMRRAGF